MDTTCSLADWNTDVGFGSPVSTHRKSLGLENELVELLWENGDILLHSQTQRKQPTIRSNNHTPNTLIQDDETVSWITSPIDESFDKDFCANFLSENPPIEPKFGGVSDVENVFSTSPPRFESFKKTGFCHNKQDSIMTIGSSHCASNQANNEMDMSYGVEENHTETGIREQAITSSSGGSGSSFWKTSNVSNDNNRHKRKKIDMQESQCQSDATELESGSGNKMSQKPGTSRRTRVAEVHNLSERRRRDRINEKMRALQELIPHSNKSDKASMLDEAIEYMKSLQLQIQLMWMGSGMAPMMIPSMQQYMSRLGMAPGPPMHPAIQNLMLLSSFPPGDQAINTVQMTNQAQIGQTQPMLSPVYYQNQLQNSRFAEQYASYMAFQSTQNTLQPMNMFNFGTHSAQQNHGVAPPGNGDGLVG